MAVAIFMLGAGLGAVITPPLTVWTMQFLGWQWAFIITGSLGLVWVILWQRWYHAPETHPAIDPAEQALVLENRSGQQSEAGWTSLLSHREFWGILIARVVSISRFTSFCFGCPNTSSISEALISGRSRYSPGCPGLPLISARLSVA